MFLWIWKILVALISIPMDIKEVQIKLFSELRERYPTEARIEVTILMLEIVQNKAEIDLFNTHEEYVP